MMPHLRQSTASANGDKQTSELAGSGAAEVFFVPETGQIYDDYEKYIGGLVQQNQPIWTCKFTGKGNLTFWEALESERKAQELLDAFPDQWKAPVLRMVQHSTM